MITVTPARFYQIAPISGLQTLYTNPSSTTSDVSRILVHCTAATSSTFTAYLVPTGSSAGLTNRIFNFDLYPGQTVDLVFSKKPLTMINNGELLQASSSISNGLNVIVEGFTRTP